MRCLIQQRRRQGDGQSLAVTPDLGHARLPASFLSFFDHRYSAADAARSANAEYLARLSTLSA
jgi:hypothetical protein